jgi:hypothetical protein
MTNFSSSLPRLALLLTLLLPGTYRALAQTPGVGIGTPAPDASAALDIVSSSKGALMPRITEAARLAMGVGAVPAPATGLIVYQTDGTAPGFWYASSPSTWVRLGDTGTADTQYIQNQVAAAQTGDFRISGTGTAAKLGVAGVTAPFGQLANTATNIVGSDGQGGNGGSLAWSANQAGYVGMFYNAATGASRNGLTVKVAGTDAGATVLDVSSGAAQAAVGTNLFRVRANGNVGVGVGGPSYKLDVAGDVNTTTMLRLSGNPALYKQNSNLFVGTDNYAATAPTGVTNTFVGHGSGSSLTSGINNTALGYLAGDALADGSSNVLVGIQAGGTLVSGIDNVFIGHDPGSLSTAGNRNVGIGSIALRSTEGNDNTGLGQAAGGSLTTGNFNTFVGSNANLSSSTTQHNRATALGYNAKVDQDDAVVLGDPSNSAVKVGIGTPQPGATLHVAGATSTVRLQGLTGTGTRVVTADLNGNLGTTTASLADNLGNHTATTNLNLGTNLLTGGGSTGLAVAADGSLALGGLGLAQRLNSTSLLLGNAGNSTFTGTGNYYFGDGAGAATTTGGDNTYLGYQAGAASTSAGDNTAVGFQAGVTATGSASTLVGVLAGAGNAGVSNIAVGGAAGYTVSGNNNTLLGYGAGFTGSHAGGANVVVGYFAGPGNTGGNNVFVGGQAGNDNGSGTGNVYVGSLAGRFNTDGTNNTMLGTGASSGSGGTSFTNATAIGAGALVQQSNSLVLGNSANVGIGTSTPSAKLHVNGAVKVEGTNTLELGGGLTKQADAGKIGYQAFSGDALDIVGAGTTGANRKVKLYAEGGTTLTGALTTAGTITAPTGDSYAFTTAQSRTVTVSCNSFQPMGTGGWNTGFVGPSNNVLAGYIPGGTAGTAQSAFADLTLPDGATITDISARVLDNSNAYSLTVTLQAVALSTGIVSSTVGITAASGVATASPTPVTLTGTGINTTVDNSTYRYQIRFSTVEANTALRIAHATVTYTVSKAD